MEKAPKKFHTVAGKEVHDILNEIIQDHHAALNRSEFMILYKHGGWESKGRRILGKVQVLTEALRITFKKDAIIYINKDAWFYLTVAQRKYLIDHELCHLDIIKDKNFDTVEMSDGRPKLTTVPHDLEDFVDVVQRHGIIMEDVKNMVRAVTAAKQVTLEEAMKYAPTDNAAKEFRDKAAEATGETVTEPADVDDPIVAGIEEQADIEPPTGVTDLGKARATRTTKKEKEEAARLAAEAEQAVQGATEATGSDDDLPF